MFGMFTPKASTRKRETLDDLDEGFQQTLLQLNDVDSPPDDMERASLTKALKYYITEMKDRTMKLEALQAQVQLAATTPSVGMNTAVNVNTNTAHVSSSISTTGITTAPANAVNPPNILMTPMNAPVTTYLPFQATAMAPFMQNTPSKTPVNLKNLQDDIYVNHLDPKDLNDHQGGTILNNHID